MTSEMKKYTINLNIEAMEVIESHYLSTGIPRNQVIRELVNHFAANLIDSRTISGEAMNINLTTTTK